MTCDQLRKEDLSGSKLVFLDCGASVTSLGLSRTWYFNLLSGCKQIQSTHNLGL